MPDMREEFEAYIAGVRERVEARGFEPLGDAIEKWMLHAWQANRAALSESLELPPVEFARGYEEETLVYHAKSLEEALQQAGIEVKQP